MAAVHPFRCVLAALVLGAGAFQAHALQLGESAAQIAARHGAPGAEDHRRNATIYFWENWSVQIEFQAGIAKKLSYRKNAYLEETDIASLLEANGGAGQWKETTGHGEKSRAWLRAGDGAAASCDAVRATTITFQGGAPRPDAPRPAGPATTVAVSAQPILAPAVASAPEAARPPAALDRAAPMREEKPARPAFAPRVIERSAQPASPIADSPPTQKPAPRALPKLPAIEPDVTSENSTEPVSVAGPQKIAPIVSLRTIVPAAEPNPRAERVAEAAPAVPESSAKPALAAPRSNGFTATFTAAIFKNLATSVTILCVGLAVLAALGHLLKIVAGRAASLASGTGAERDAVHKAPETTKPRANETLASERGKISRFPISAPAVASLPELACAPERFTAPNVFEAAHASAFAGSAAPAPAGIDELTRDQFELLIGELFRREGYVVELSAALGGDGGIDLTLRRDCETVLVQCKHWKTANVAAREMREFYGAMAAGGAPRGVFVTTGNFTRDAREFAAGKSIELVDGAALQSRIDEAARPGENLLDIASWIEEFTAHAHIFDPECPFCRGSMALRQNRTTGAPFWGCVSYPRCSGKRDPRLDLMRVES